MLRFHLERNQTKEAVFFASHYQQLVYFAHALEILLHEVLEDEVALRTLLPEDERLLPRAIEFLDHFDEALQVVVGCARKTEVTHWPLLFDTVGKPRDLFEVSSPVPSPKSQSPSLNYRPGSDLHDVGTPQGCCVISPRASQP